MTEWLEKTEACLPWRESSLKWALGGIEATFNPHPVDSLSPIQKRALIYYLHFQKPTDTHYISERMDG